VKKHQPLAAIKSRLGKGSFHETDLLPCTFSSISMI